MTMRNTKHIETVAGGGLLHRRLFLSSSVGAAGLVEAGTGRLIFAPNLAWRNALLTEHLWDAIGLPAFADNDNNVAAWGEYRHGAARGYRHVRGGDRSCDRGARRAAVRLRQPRLLGTGREWARPDARRP